VGDLRAGKNEVRAIPVKNRSYDNSDTRDVPDRYRFLLAKQTEFKDIHHSA
jgi:hypothetical protein